MLSTQHQSEPTCLWYLQDPIHGQQELRLCERNGSKAHCHLPPSGRVHFLARLSGTQDFVRGWTRGELLLSAEAYSSMRKLTSETILDSRAVGNQRNAFARRKSKGTPILDSGASG
jgi:hypothetical protein